MNKIYNFLTAPVTVICSLVISFLLTFFTGGLGTLFGILVVLLILISGKWDWKEFGLVTRLSLRTIIRALVIACIIYILIDVLLQPVIEKAFGVLDLSALDAIRGNFTNLGETE